MSNDTGYPPTEQELQDRKAAQHNERALSRDDEIKVAKWAASGVSFREIGKRLKVSHTTAWRTMQRLMREHHDEHWNSLKEFVARESMRLDRLDQTFMPMAEQGSKDAATIVLATHRNRVRLAAAAGLTAAQKHQVNVTGTGASPMLDQEIQDLLGKIAANDAKSTTT